MLSALVALYHPLKREEYEVIVLVNLGRGGGHAWIKPASVSLRQAQSTQAALVLNVGLRFDTPDKH
jgi:hypothetical protein